MTTVTPDTLRDISVKVVEGFLNDKVPLSIGLAKQASENQLNPDQIQRCVEASNTIAHLKLMESAADRTFEFPLCEYNHVLAEIAQPGITKEAGLADYARKGATAVRNVVNDFRGVGQAGQAVAKARAGVADYEKVRQDLQTMAESGRTDTGWIGRMRRENQKDLAEAKQLLKTRIDEERTARSLAGARLTMGTAGVAGLGTAGYLGAQAYGNSHVKSASETDPAETAATKQMCTTLLVKEAAVNKAEVERLEDRAIIVQDSLEKLASVVRKDPYVLDKVACALEPDVSLQVTALIFGEPKQVKDFGSARGSLFKEAELLDVKKIADLYKEARQILRSISDRSAAHEKAASVLPAIGKAFGSAIGGALRSASSVVAPAVKDVGNVGANFVKPKAKQATLGFAGNTAKLGGTLALNATMLGYDPGVSSAGRSKSVWDALQS